MEPHAQARGHFSITRLRSKTFVWELHRVHPPKSRTIDFSPSSTPPMAGWSLAKADEKPLHYMLFFNSNPVLIDHCPALIPCQRDNYGNRN